MNVDNEALNELSNDLADKEILGQLPQETINDGEELPSDQITPEQLKKFISFCNRQANKVATKEKQLDKRRKKNKMAKASRKRNRKKK